MGLGMGEVLLILVVALVVFGPRKLPELGKSLGQAMAQFRRASEDFKRTWEQEVEMEKIRRIDSTSGNESTHGYNESYDPYNSYSDEAGGRETGGKEAESNSTGATSTRNEAVAEAAPAGAETSGPTTRPEKKHWI